MRRSDISRKAERPHTGYCHMAFGVCRPGVRSTRGPNACGTTDTGSSESPETTGDGFMRVLLQTRTESNRIDFGDNGR